MKSVSNFFDFYQINNLFIFINMDDFDKLEAKNSDASSHKNE